MPLGAALSSISLLLQNINVKKPTVHVLKNITPDKPVIFSDKNINYLDRAKPEEFGYTTEYIESFLNEVTSDLSVRPNRVIIVKGDKVIGERYAHPYVKDAWNCVFSATKTVTALALGLLYDDGLVNLDEPVCNILDIANKVGNLQNKKITLRHLLTMSTGNTFNEVESAVSTKWVKDFFNSGNKFKIGSKFDYNSLNTYIIGACVEKLSGKHLSELVNERIFKPLGINDTYFEVSPEGIAKSGWGLFIIPEDMAKLGIMFRDYGVYKGQRILSEDWIKQMSSKQIASTKAGHRYDYGYQMWVKEEINLSFFNGMYNQDILMFRDSGVVVVMCCANNEAFHGSNHYPMVEKYFATKEMGNFELIKTPGSHDYPNNESLMHYYDSIVDKEFCPTNKKANACGILPLLLQNEMGTYAKGIKKMMFTKQNENYSLSITEGTEQYVLKFNFEEGIRQKYEYCGNLYDCVVDARFILNGKGDPFLVIRMYFLEFASSRYFSFKFGKHADILSVEALENPGLDFILALLEMQDKATKALLSGLSKIVDLDVVEMRAKNVFSPTFVVKHTPPKID